MLKIKITNFVYGVLLTVVFMMITHIVISVYYSYKNLPYKVSDSYTVIDVSLQNYNADPDNKLIITGLHQIINRDQKLIVLHENISRQVLHLFDINMRYKNSNDYFDISDFTTENKNVLVYEESIYSKLINRAPLYFAGIERNVVGYYDYTYVLKSNRAGNNIILPLNQIKNIIGRFYFQYASADTINDFTDLIQSQGYSYSISFFSTSDALLSIFGTKEIISLFPVFLIIILSCYISDRISLIRSTYLIRVHLRYGADYLRLLRFIFYKNLGTYSLGVLVGACVGIFGHYLIYRKIVLIECLISIVISIIVFISIYAVAYIVSIGKIERGMDHA